MNRFRISLITAVVVLAVACLVYAQSAAQPQQGSASLPVPPTFAVPDDGPKDSSKGSTSASEPPKDSSKGSSSGSVSGQLPDPTVPEGHLKELLDKKPGTLASRLPLVTLRGRVLAKDRTPTAMLELDGKLYVVIKGSTLATQGNTMLKIIELKKDVSPLNEVIILR